MKADPRFTVSPWYPTASYPYGKPVAARRVRYVSAVQTRTSEALEGLQLPLSAWTVTVYDDKPRVFNVRECNGVWFQTRSMKAALAGIAARCDASGKVAT